MQIRTLSLVAALALAPLAPHVARATCARDAMLVMDGSASMAELGFDSTAPTRIMEARDALRQAMPDITPVRRVGLVTYGPGPEGSCEGITLRFAPQHDAAERIIATIDTMEPLGLTPLTDSVRLATEVLGPGGVVVLVTDGHETCGGRPCALGAELAARRPGITVHVIGFRVAPDPFAWDSPEAAGFAGTDSVARCISDATGGLYVNTETVEELVEALRVTLGCALIGDARPHENDNTPAL